MAAAVTFILFLLITVSGCVAKLTTTPRSTVATLQQENPVVLSCKTDKPGTTLSWSFNDSTNIIFSGYTKKERYPVSMNLEAGEFNISLSSLDASYAGRYTCLEPGSLEHASAQLTILESDPHCTSTNLNSTDNDRKVYMLACKINYRGQLIPRVTWRIHNSSHATQVKSETRRFSSGDQWTTLVSWLNVSATELNIYYNATTTFQINSSTSQKHTDTNNPHYRYTWTTSPQLSITQIEESAPVSVTIINIAMYVAGGVSALLLLVLLLFVISIRLEYRGCGRNSADNPPDLVYNVSAAARREAENAARVRANEDDDNEDDESLNDVSINDDYMEPLDSVNAAAAAAAAAADGRNGNDDNSEPQYANVTSTRRSQRRRKPVSCRPYADRAQYAAIDHRIGLHGQTIVVVVDEP